MKIETDNHLERTEGNGKPWEIVWSGLGNGQKNEIYRGEKANFTYQRFNNLK